MIERAYGSLLERGLSKRSVQQAHAVLHRALQKALHWDLLGKNPADFVSIPRPERREMKTLDQEQLRRLFEFTQGERLHALWVVLATTGMRLGEALGLRWDDIDMEEGTLHVNRALPRQADKGLVLAERKTQRSRRLIHLATSVVSVIEDLRCAQIEERVQAGAGWMDLSLIFSSTKGRPVQPSYVSLCLQRALRKADLPRIRVHDLRHTAASILLAKGRHPKVVQELLGHSTIALTMDTYSHVSPALHAQVAEDMETLFESSQNLKEEPRDSI